VGPARRGANDHVSLPLHPPGTRASRCARRPPRASASSQVPPCLNPAAARHSATAVARREAGPLCGRERARRRACVRVCADASPRRRTPRRPVRRVGEQGADAHGCIPNSRPRIARPPRAAHPRTSLRTTVLQLCKGWRRRALCPAQECSLCASLPSPFPLNPSWPWSLTRIFFHGCSYNWRLNSWFVAKSEHFKPCYFPFFLRLLHVRILSCRVV